MIIHGAKPKSAPDLIEKRLEILTLVFRECASAMHRMDGTQPDAEFGGPEMRIAAHNLETAYLWAKAAVEQN